LRGDQAKGPSSGGTHVASHGAAVILMDLDNLTQTNDALGHEAGDTRICEIASAASGVLRTGDVTARLGADESIMLFG